MTPVRREDDRDEIDFRSHRQNRNPIWQWGVGLSITIIGIMFAWVIQPLNAKIDNLTTRLVAVEVKADTARDQRSEQLQATRELTTEVLNLRMEVIGLRGELQTRAGKSAIVPFYQRELPKFGKP